MLCCRSSIKSARRSVISLLEYCFARRFDFGAGKRAADFRFIVLLLGHGNGLGRVADLDPQLAAGRSDAEVLIAEPTDEIKRLLHRLLLREPERVRLDLGLDRRAHVSRGAKEAIRRHQTFDALVRSLEVVVLYEEADAPLAVGEVGEHCLAQKLFPQGLPEALDLAERLGVLRSALAVLDAVAPQELLKLGLPAPRRVLSTLVRQHFTRMSVFRDASFERLDY